jgi:group I intron endonuclease
VAFVYLITNKINGMQYVGFTTKTPEIRLAEHARSATLSGTVILHTVIRKHGVENFSVETLFSGTRDEALEKESFYINQLNTQEHDRGYNRSNGGTAPMAGRKHTEEFKETLSKRMKGKKYALGNKLSPDVRRRMGESRKGNTHTLGRKQSNEEIERRRFALRTVHENNPELKNKQARRSRETWLNPEIREKRLSGQRISLQRPEYREHMRLKALAQWQNPTKRASILAGRKKAKS